MYHITSELVVPLHNHMTYDEVFYCIKGAGFGVLEDQTVALSIGQSFIVTAGKMHALRSDSDLYVISFLIPLVD